MNCRLSHIFLLTILLFISQNAHSQKWEVKEYTKKAPASISRSPQKLAEYLTQNDSSDFQRAFNIYTWIAHNIDYDVKALKRTRRKRYTVYQTLKRKKGICHQFTDLYETLCRNTGISALTISGYNKGFRHFDEERFYEGSHAWNGVKLDSTWYLVDVTFGSGKLKREAGIFDLLLYKWFRKPYIKNKYSFIKEVKNDYFLVNPQEYIKSHLPEDPSWQLLFYPVSIQTFDDPDWDGYKHKLDSISPKKMNIKINEKILDDYEFLSPNQYLYENAIKAHQYNPANYIILAHSSVHNASTTSSLMKTVNKSIEKNNESIKHFESAIQYSKQHQNSANLFTTQAIRKTQGIIKKDLLNFSKLRTRSLSKKNIRMERSFLRKSRQQERNIEAINSLNSKLENFKSKSLSEVRFDKNSNSELIKTNNEELSQKWELINCYQDSTIKLQKKLEHYISKKDLTQDIIVELKYGSHEFIKTSIARAIENLNIKEVNGPLLQFDSLQQVIHTSELALKGIYDSIYNLSHALIQLQSALESNYHYCQRLLFQNCRFSHGKDCENAKYWELNQSIKKTYHTKISTHTLMVKAEKSDQDFNKKLFEIINKELKLLRNHQKMILHFQKNRIKEIENKRDNSIFVTNEIINYSMKGINRLKKKNFKLERKLRETEAY